MIDLISLVTTNELFSIVSSSFPLLRIHVDHKKAVSDFNGGGRVKTHL